jgi:hypothetical protein
VRIVGGAAIAGGLLFALPAAGGLYRGTFDWPDLIVALMGMGIAAAMGSARNPASGIDETAVHRLGDQP